MNQPDLDIWHMRRALELAARGQGAVEPNPMAGCVIAHGAEIIGEGWHRRFGGDHAEVEALGLAGSRARGASLYATLEPCCHQGKTPPCTRAILAAGVGRVVAAMLDPFVQVAGGGLAELAAAGIAVDVGLLEDDARQLNAPYLKLLATGRPWVMAKWAMTLDGKIATRTGQSRWISGPLSREAVHRLRGRVDAILTGRGTVQRDDPLLTARPGDCPDFRGHHRAPTRSVGRHGRENGTVPFRTATRVVVDSRASLGSGSQLVRTAGEAPVLVAAGPEASEADRRRLSDLGCEVAIFDGPTPAARLGALLDDLGRRRMTNVLVEAGGRLLGSLLDARLIDEVHVFLGPKLLGGAEAPGPIAGHGIDVLSEALALEWLQVEQLDTDVYIHGRIRPG